MNERRLSRTQGPRMLNSTELSWSQLAWLSPAILNKQEAGAKKRKDPRLQQVRTTVVDPRTQGSGG